MFLTNPPGPWQSYLNRVDNKGLPLMEVKSKYMQEQLLFENYMNFQMQQQMLMTQQSSGGGPSLSITTSTIVLDPDAQAFITAAEITDPIQQSAINNLVVGLKVDGLWTNMQAIYPFVGGTASTHKWNLKDPRDLDAAYRLQFNGGITHSNNGALPNGTNGYANTFLNPSLVLSSTSIHFSNYYRTDYLLSATHEFGCQVVIDFGTEEQYSIGYHTLLPNQISGMYFANGMTGNTDFIITTNNIGNYIVSRTASNVNKLFKNGTLLKSNSSSSGNADAQMYLMGKNNRYIPNDSVTYGRKELAFCTIGSGLTDTQSTNLNTLIQSFQTTLNRNV